MPSAPFCLCTITQYNQVNADRLLSSAIDLLKMWNIQIFPLFIVDANIFLSACAFYHRGMWEMVMVVLWYIYSCQSVTPWDSDKINSWDVASYHLQYQGAHTPVMQAIQFYLIYPKPIYKLSVSIRVRFTYLQKSCAAVIREQRPTTQVNYSTAVQKKSCKSC